MRFSAPIAVLDSRLYVPSNGVKILKLVWTNIKIPINLNMSSDFLSGTEQLTLNQLVRGSNPCASSRNNKQIRDRHRNRLRFGVD